MGAKELRSLGVKEYSCRRKSFFLPRKFIFAALELMFHDRELMFPRLELMFTDREYNFPH